MENYGRQIRDAELAMSEIEGRDFQVRLRKRDGVAVVIAPHEGGIEPGTSEVADAIAANDLSFYAFEGIKAVGNRRNLHITSTRFDEPRCLDLVRASPQAVSIHGEDSDDQVVYLGGRAVVTLGANPGIPSCARLQIRKAREPAPRGIGPSKHL